MINFLDKKAFNYLFGFLVFILIIEFLVLRDLPFFWDAISKSNRANWIYENNLKSFIVPTEINSGHPPLWIFSLALFWKILGKSILTARFLLLLVNIGVVYQILIFCKNNLIKTVPILASCIVFVDPTFVAQTTSLNNDMLLLFFTLLALNVLMGDSKQWLFSIAITGLLLSNLRGIYITVAIFFIHIIYINFHFIKKNKKLFLGYLIGIAVFAFFCFFQYKTLGWFIVTENKSYGAHRQPVGGKMFLINLVVYLKCFLEYGRFIILIILLPLLTQYLKNKSFHNQKTNKILIAIIVFLVVFFVGMVPFSNPIGPRYFMILYLLAIVLFLNLIFCLKKPKLYKNISFLIISFFLISGHFWVYPATLSQPWDSSLAYLNYYKIEKEMEDYIHKFPIQHHEIGTRIRLNARDYSELIILPNEAKYSNFNIKENQYILYSNIENYTKDEELMIIQNNWILVKKIQNKGVFISLYKNPNL